VQEVEVDLHVAANEGVVPCALLPVDAKHGKGARRRGRGRKERRSVFE
jgi:hypothetical protein